MARWRRGDTEAFNAVTSAGEKLRTAYEKSQLGQAYREGGEVTKPEDQAQLDDYKAQGLGARQSIDENNWYTPGTPEGAAAEAQNASAARLAKSYDQSYDAGSKYRVGSQSYDQAPTPQQLHRGGLERQMAFLASRGDVEGASTLGERISGLDTAAQQRELVKGQLARQPLELEALTRAATRDKTELAREQTRDNTIKTFSAAREAALKGDYGPLQEIVGRQYNNQLPGLNDGNTIQFLDGGGVVKFDPRTKQGFTAPLNEKTATQLLDEGLSKRLAAISSKDWQAEREFMRVAGKDENEAEYRARMASVAERETARKSEEDKATAAYRTAYLGILGRKADSAGSKGQPLGMTPDGQVIERDKKGDYVTKPIMIDGKPATADQLKLFKKLYTTEGPDPNDPMVEVEEQVGDKKIKMKVPLSVANPAQWRDLDTARKAKTGGGALGGYKADGASTPSAGAGAKVYGEGFESTGMLTPWDDVTKRILAGDQNAIKYARARMIRGPGIIGSTKVPEEVMEALAAVDRSF
jgi:hypothetical protein